MCWTQKVVTRWRRERTSSAAPPRKTNDDDDDDDMFAATSTSLSTTYSACFRRRRQEQQQVSSYSSTRKTNLRIRASSSSKEPAKIQETYQFHSPGKVTFAHETEEEQSKWTNCGISHVGDVNEDAKVKLGVVIGTSFCPLSKKNFI